MRKDEGQCRIQLSQDLKCRRRHQQSLKFGLQGEFGQRSLGRGSEASLCTCDEARFLRSQEGHKSSNILHLAQTPNCARFDEPVHHLCGLRHRGKVLLSNLCLDETYEKY